MFSLLDLNKISSRYTFLNLMIATIKMTTNCYCDYSSLQRTLMPLFSIKGLTGMFFGDWGHVAERSALDTCLAYFGRDVLLNPRKDFVTLRALVCAPQPEKWWDETRQASARLRAPHRRISRLDLWFRAVSGPHTWPFAVFLACLALKLLSWEGWLGRCSRAYMGVSENSACLILGSL